MDYRDYNDSELLSYIAENNEEANEIIFKKYEPLIVTISKRMYRYCKNAGVEMTDLIQEGRLGLNVAINGYQISKDATFYTYARTCIERGIINYVVRAKRQKNRVLNESLSLELPDDEQYKFEKIFADNSQNPEIQVLEYEREQELINNVKGNLTDFEQQVFELKLASFSYKEIAEILEKDLKAVDNALQRIRIKAREQINI
ncbi:MAG: sigma-70 family RNA polymerase sigma factor [Bacilli bacterium]|nr:sigma-70 family RNA polymerase sigma factor [Bacilli bacterium]MCI9434129.1 sigma-70 family RNA polymerase sigma factor [Bacilli bacterium]